jgi:protein DGCR14
MSQVKSITLRSGTNTTSSAMSAPKPPPSPVPERSLNRQVVLEEDEYTAALSHIIARDFFPSLVHLDATNDYLDALHSRDPHLIDASVRRLEEISSTPSATRHRASYQTPSQTPYRGGPSETPFRTLRGEPPAKRARYDTEISLDTFQARYTSEDNSSFTQILDEENRKRKERWAWAWDAQKRVEEQRERLIEGRERMLIEAAPVVGVREKFMIEVPTPAGLITDGQVDEEKGEEEEVEAQLQEEEVSGKGKEVVIMDKEREEDLEVDVMAPKKDTRSAGVDGWKFKVCRFSTSRSAGLLSSNFIDSKFFDVLA